jgi:hypothetical protein
VLAETSLIGPRVKENIEDEILDLTRNVGVFSGGLEEAEKQGSRKEYIAIAAQRPYYTGTY